MLEMFISGFVLSLSLCLDLGIVNVAAFSTAATRGVKPAFVLGLGSCFGDLAYALIAMLGVTSFLHVEGVRWVLWLGGSAVLLYLAAKMLKQSLRTSAHLETALPASSDTGTVAGEGNGSSFAGDFSRGFAMAISSPSAILWFASVGGGLIATATVDTRGTGSQVWPFFCGFFIAGVAWSAFVAFAGSRAIAAGTSFVRGLAAISALLFAALALKLMLDGYATLIQT